MTELVTLRIHWPARWRTVFSIAMVIEVDGREVGRLRNGQDLVTYVEPGPHILRARGVGKSEPVELVLAPGEDVRLETRLYTKNFWDLFKTLSLVRTDVAGGTPPNGGETPPGTGTPPGSSAGGSGGTSQAGGVSRASGYGISADHGTSAADNHRGGDSSDDGSYIAFYTAYYGGSSHDDSGGSHDAGHSHDTGYSDPGHHL